MLTEKLEEVKTTNAQESLVLGKDVGILKVQLTRSHKRAKNAEFRRNKPKHACNSCRADNSGTTHQRPGSKRNCGTAYYACPKSEIFDVPSRLQQ